MAESPTVNLVYGPGCPDCGRREVVLPPGLPPVGDDFDWLVRDYDGFRLFMLEELAARFPERRRWTPADIEAVLTEAMATLLDQLSDMADRVTAEAYLESARRPQSVRRLLWFIGYNAVQQSGLQGEPETKPDRLTAVEQLERLWTREPELMERARREGPRAVHNQHRMVTVADYTVRLEEHPLVRRAAARSRWTGSWITMQVAVVLPYPGACLDDAVDLDLAMKTQVTTFHMQRGLPEPDFSTRPAPSYRMLLQSFVDAYRMAGQEVVLQDAIPVGIRMELSLRVAPGYFQSEVRRAVTDVLGTQPGGFFAPGRLRFGEDLHASDILQVLLKLEGVENVCLNRFKRVGTQYPDHVVDGLIVLDGLDLAVCDNDPRDPSRGYYRLKLIGGRLG